MSDGDRRLCDTSPHRPPATHRRRLTGDEYFAGVRSGDIAILPRALTLIESHLPRHQLQAEQLLTRLLPYTGQSTRVGISGSPGAGKSTFIESLGLHLLSLGKRVAVLAIDPSSGISGGSILGDKTRMSKLATARNAFIRPSPTAGTLGGVARKTRESMLVCEAAGFDVVLIETVGVGQSETMVADMTDCFLALMLPGAGDELQGIKRGLLELVDVVAVNKADGSTRTAAELAAQQYALALQSIAGRDGEKPEVLTCSALHNRGVDRVWETIEQLHQRMQASGEWTERRRQQNLRWLWSLVEERCRDALRAHAAVRALRGPLERAVLDGTLAPEAAARQITDAFGLSEREPSPPSAGEGQPEGTRS